MRSSAVSLLFAAGLVVVAGSRSGPTTCHNLLSQTSMDLEKMLGQWFAVEIVEHRMPEIRTGRTEVNKCPIFILKREANHTGSKSTAPFRLLWEEGDMFSVEYRLTIPEENHKGFWRSSGLQNGSVTRDERYRQFNGSVHVMKVTGDHAVLTFCSEKETEVFSVVLSREPVMGRSQLISIENMLDRRSLPVLYVKTTCRLSRRNSARATGTPHAAILALGLSFLLTRQK